MRYKNGLKQLGLFSFFMFILFCIACKKQDDSIGQNLLPGSDEIYVLSNDTTPMNVNSFAADLTTFRTDETYGHENLLIGNYNDPVFGQVKTTGYLQFDKTLPIDLPLSFVVDSVVLNLVYAAYSYGKEIPMSLKVQQLQHSLDRNEDNTASDIVATNTENLILTGYELMRIPMNSLSSVSPNMRIRLQPEFGEVLLREAHDNENGNDFFVDDFKGIAISSTTLDGKIFAISHAHIGTKISVYYKENNTSGQTLQDQKMYDFLVNDNCAAFTHIDYNRGNSDIPNLDEETELNGQALAYMQAGAGAYIEVDFSQLEWMKQHPDAIINSAVLIMPFDSSSYLPTLKFEGYTKSDAGTFTKISDKVEGFARTDNTFRVELTKYIQDWLEGVSSNSTIFFRPSPILYINRVVLHGPEHSPIRSQNMRLSITYTID